MAAYITFREGFFNNVKNRVQTNVGNAMNAVSGVANKVANFSNNMANTATNFSNNVNNLKNRVVGGNTTNNNIQNNQQQNPMQNQPVNNGPRLAQVSNIKRQIPNGSSNTLSPLKNRQMM